MILMKKSNEGKKKVTGMIYKIKLMKDRVISIFYALISLLGKKAEEKRRKQKEDDLEEERIQRERDLLYKQYLEEVNKKKKHLPNMLDIIKEVIILTVVLIWISG